MSVDQLAWDYRWVDARAEDDIAALGARGWEIVAIVASRESGVPRACLKRQRRTFRERVALDQKRHVYHLLGVPLPEDDR